MLSFPEFTEILEWSDWDTPPEEMRIEIPFHALLDQVRELLNELTMASWPCAASEATASNALHERATMLYVSVPAIVNVMLNYKICVEHGLPLHPTVYYELKEARKYRISHSLGEIQRASELFWKSIEVARACYRLEPDARTALTEYAQGLPASVQEFIYTSVQDHYTWLGSRPSLLRELAKKVRAAYDPQIIVAAAHGSIMPALILSELLDIPLYFIRFSMFKRRDEEPILSLSDQAWLFDYRDKNALFYDEDVAGGRTLELFFSRMKPLFGKVRTACSIRHAGASIHPDFAGKTWWD